MTLIHVGDQIHVVQEEPAEVVGALRRALAGEEVADFVLSTGATLIIGAHQSFMVVDNTRQQAVPMQQQSPP